MHSYAKRALAAAVAGLFAVGFTGHSQAGIVVLKNGEVFVGKVRDDGVTSDSIVLHGVRGQDGRIALPRHRVRWYDAEANELTPDYFGAYLDETLLGDRWIRDRETYIANQSPPPAGPFEGTGILLSRPTLDVIPNTGNGFNVRKPAGWEASVENGILVLKAPRTAPSGFTPRIHVFSVASVDSDRSDQVEWIRAELERVSGLARLQIVELSRLRKVTAGENHRLVTETSLRARKVLAVREVCFRDERTYFFAGYADAREFTGLRTLLEQSLESLTLSND